jgi:excisionase family DNA binding protein
MNTTKTTLNRHSRRGPAEPWAADRSRPDLPLAPLERPALRLSEIAGRLAISRAAAYRLVRSGQLQAIRVGQTWRVLRADFDAYLDGRRAEAEGRYRAARDDP